MTNIAWRNLTHQRARFALSTGGVAFAVMLILIVSGLYEGILTQATEYARTADAHVWVSQAGTPDSLVQSQSVLATDLESQLETVPGVASASPLLTRPVAFELGGAAADLFVVGVDGPRAAGWPRALAGTGTIPAPGELVLDRVFAKRHGLAQGDVLTVNDAEFRVAAVVRGGNALVYQYAWGRLTDVRDLTGAGDTVSHFLVRAQSGRSAHQLADALAQTVPGVRARVPEALADAEAAHLGEAFRPMLAVLVVIALAVGAATIGLIIYTATIEKTREYGVLKAIGFSNRRLYGVVLQQSLIAAAVGLVAGCVLAFGVAAFAELVQPVFVTTITATHLLSAASATVVMGLVASTIPARPIARLHPAEVFRA